MHDNDDELNARELEWERGQEKIVVASLFFPFNRASSPTISFSIVARDEYNELISKLISHNVWLHKPLFWLTTEDIEEFESWILEA